MTKLDLTQKTDTLIRKKLIHDILDQLNSKFNKKFKLRNIRTTDDFFKIPFEEYKKGFIKKMNGENKESLL